MEGKSPFPNHQLFLQAVFERASEAIAIVDKRDRFVDVNPAACRLFGARKKQLLGNSISKWFGCILHEELAEVSFKQSYPTIIY
jgi:two-component system, OmpR family, sensor histidine kinase VicK